MEGSRCEYRGHRGARERGGGARRSETYANDGNFFMQTFHVLLLFEIFIRRLVLLTSVLLARQRSLARAARGVGRGCSSARASSGRWVRSWGFSRSFLPGACQPAHPSPLVRSDVRFDSSASAPATTLTPSGVRRFRGCDLRAVCQTAGATAWASDWAAPGLVAFLLPALGNGAWVILLTLHINGSRRTRGGSGAANGAFGVPARLVRPLGRLAGALAAILGAFVTYLTYENASETARAASAGVGAVTPRTQHVGWYLAIFADGVTAFAGFVACVFGRGAVCGPSKKQLSARVADDELLRVISTKPTPTQVGVTPRGERVMRVGRPAPSGEAHRKHGGAFARRTQPERMEKPRSFSHTSRVSERERARERAAWNARAAANARGRYGGAAYAGEASRSEPDTSSGEEGTSSDESSETYEDVERGKRHLGTGARARVPEPAAGQGGWENWKAAFWKSSAGAAAAAAASAARAAGGATGSGSASGDVGRTFSGVSAPEEDMAYRAERDARAARLKSLAKSPETRASRPRAFSSAFDQHPKPPRGETVNVNDDFIGAAPVAEASPVGATGRRDRSPAPVYELSSSDEEFLEHPRPSESPDSVAEARSPLLSPVNSGARARVAGSEPTKEPISLRQRAELGNRA